MRYWLHRLTFVVTLLSSLLSGLANANASHPITILRIDAQSADGTAIGTVLGQQIKQQFPEVEAIYDAYLAASVSQLQFDEWLSTELDTLKLGIPPLYRAEIQAIAATWAITSHDRLGDGLLSMHEFWLLQLLPDLTRIAQGSGFGVWQQAAAEGYTMVGRNLDWSSSTAELRSLQAITVYDYGHSSIANVGLAGYVGVLTGYNSNGVFVAHFDSPQSVPYPAPPPAQRVIGFDLRQALETQKYVTGISHLLSRTSYARGHSILLADQQQVIVLEHPLGQVAQVRTDSSELTQNLTWEHAHQIAVVNCFALRTAPSNCNDTWDTFRWYRFKRLAGFSATHPAQLGDISAIMFDKANGKQAIFNVATLQSLVFIPHERKLHLYTAPTEATQSDYLSRYEIANIFSQQHSSSIFSIGVYLLLLLLGLLLVVVLVYGELPRLQTWWQKPS